MARAAPPPSRASAMMRWSTGASGVVRSPCRVPITVVAKPPASSTEASMWVTVVLPLVPVTPTVANERAGWPNNEQARRAIDGRARPAPTTICTASSSRGHSTTRATAPRLRADAANWCPSDALPGTQQNTAPGSTWRLSNSTDLTSMPSRSPRVSTTSTSSSSRSIRNVAPLPGGSRPFRAVPSRAADRTCRGR